MGAQDDLRDVRLDIVQETLGQGADANAQEEDTGEFDAAVGSYTLNALQLLVTNTYASSESMGPAVDALVEAKADLNSDISDPPLLCAVQHRCVAGVEALCRHSAKVTSEVLEEVRGISAT